MINIDNPRCFFDEVGVMNKVAYLMINTFRLNYNTAIYEGSKLLKAGKIFDCFIFHIPEEDYKDAFFRSGISNYADFKTHNIKLFDDFSVLKNVLSDYDTIFVDQPYLREEIELVSEIKGNIVFVEHNVSVPVRVVSNKEEYSARTIRPKIWKEVENYRMDYPFVSEKFLFEVKATEEFKLFVKNKLENYDKRNDPSNDYQSHMSQYLKYGFISVNEMLDILDEVDWSKKESFLEEVIIRRELAFNFVFYNRNYDQFESITYDWAYQTMNAHIYDKREYIYTIDDYIQLNTHDRYFNAAMKEMLLTHSMHGYMRMYWAKKILEWSTSYKEAYETIIKLNNEYFLDGRTPNGYSNVAWIFGKHDRAWKEKQIFGKLRYMNANGLKRKFNIEEYVNRMEGLDVS